MRALTTGLCVGSLLLGGCVQTELGEAEQPIVGGGPTDGYPAVPQIVTVIDGEASACSGTLISHRVVLTAAHCLDLGGTPDTQYAYFGTDSSGGDPGFIERIDVVDRIFHDPWSLSGHDIGMVLLEYDAPVEPMELNRTPLGGADIGRSLHLVGWGDTESDAGDAGIKREVTASLSGFQNQFVLNYGNSSANTCQGDSGGPGFINEGGVDRVASITSFGTGGCFGESGGTRVAQYTSFIDPWVEQNDPVLPPTVSVTSPEPGERVKSGFPVTIEAEDNTRVERVELWVDGSLETTLTLPPYVANTPALSDGAHTVEARAYDNREDMDADSVEVTVDSSCQGDGECGGDLVCEEGQCVEPAPPGGELGDPCDASDQCNSGLCGMGADGSYCTRSCDPEASDCPEAFECLGAEEGGGVCWPTEPTGGGCAIGGRSGGAGALILLLAAAVLRRRRLDAVP